jgi:hypothetical protein
MLRDPGWENWGNSFLDKLMKNIYRTDSGFSDFPSLHVINTWVIFIAARSRDDKGKRHPIFITINAFFAVLIACSVLFVKQH